MLDSSLFDYFDFFFLFATETFALLVNFLENESICIVSDLLLQS